MALIDNGDGTPITRRAVPPKTTPSNPPATTVDTKQQVPQQGLVRAVLHSVQPNNNKPATASVLLLNKMPPRPGYSLPQDFGPVYPAGTTTYTDNSDPANPHTIAVTGPYINDPSIFEGGSFVLVDPNAKAVVQLLQGTSNQYPSSASRLLSLHKHTGGLDANGQPAPSQVNLTSHVAGILPKGHYPTIPANTTPVLIGTPVITPDHLGYPVYNVAIQFVVDDNGTTDSPWLVGSQVCAIPVGSTQDLSHGTGKILGDFLTPAAPDANKHGTYACYIGGLSAGVQYNLYLIYEDFLGGLSNYKLLGVTPDTTATKITVTNLPGLPSTLPNVIFNSVRYPVIGVTTFTAVSNFTVNWLNDNPDTWCSEIKLYAEPWDVAAGHSIAVASQPGGTSIAASGTAINAIDPQASNGAAVTYDGEFAPLQLSLGPVSTLNSLQDAFVYRLSMTFVAENGDESAKIPLTLTSQNPSVIDKRHLVAMPKGMQLSASGISVTQDYQTPGTLKVSVNNLTYTSSSGSGNVDNSLPWLAYMAVRAYRVVPITLGLYPFQSTGTLEENSPCADMTLTPVNAGSTPSYAFSMTGLANGGTYHIYLCVEDYKGNEPGWESGWGGGFQNSHNADLGRSPTVGSIANITPNTSINIFWVAQLDGNRVMHFNIDTTSDIAQYGNIIDHVRLDVVYNGTIEGTWAGPISYASAVGGARLSGSIPNLGHGATVDVRLYYITKSGDLSNYNHTTVTIP